MLWCRLGVPLVLLLLAACGFTPAYQTKDNAETMSTQQKLAAIEVMPIGGRMGQELRSRLQDTLCPLSANQPPSKYRLYITLKKNTSPAAIEKDRSITRYNVSIIASYALKHRDNNKLISKGTLRVVSSYDSLDSRFSTFVAEDKTTSNAIQELAEQLSTRLMTTTIRDDNHNNSK